MKKTDQIMDKKFKIMKTVNDKTVFATGSLMTLASGAQYAVLSTGQWVRVDK